MEQNKTETTENSKLYTLYTTCTNFLMNTDPKNTDVNAVRITLGSIFIILSCVFLLSMFLCLEKEKRPWMYGLFFLLAFVIFLSTVFIFGFMWGQLPILYFIAAFIVLNLIPCICFGKLTDL